MSTLIKIQKISLPKELGDRFDVQPGNDWSLEEQQGRIAMIKNVAGSTDGLLKHLNANVRCSEEQSVCNALNKKDHARTLKKKCT